jgi:hypothetical protein
MKQTSGKSLHSSIFREVYGGFSLGRIGVIKEKLRKGVRSTFDSCL